MKYRHTLILALTAIMAIIIWQSCVKEIIAQYYFQKGCRYRIENKWTEAIENYKKALSFSPYNIELHYRLAYAYALSGQLNKAVQGYERLDALATNYGDTDRNMGIIYIKMGKHRLAKRHLIKAMHINPHDTIALRYLNIANESDNTESRI